MPLISGTKLGPYEIQSLIGAGGMGEVYRARDTRLQRDVAVKILPSSLTQDQERLRRFEQEARAVAALNHPNLLTVFDVGTAPLPHNGAESAGSNGAAPSPYIVSELLEGSTLRTRLTAGALRERKALDYAIQIAHGLAAAHDRGIVHRDLKPDNVFVTEDGRVKILDFGLAKLTQTTPSDVDVTVQSVTQAGVVLGTIGYMSPEQVRGKSADARSDIFSFGVVLYEMLSGQKAFHGESNADVMSAILNQEPPELTATNREISPALDRIVHHCMEKTPQQRFQSAGDLAFQLSELSGIRSSTAIPAIAESAPAKVAPVKMLAAIGALALAVLLPGRILMVSTADHPEPRDFTWMDWAYGARFSADSKSLLFGDQHSGDNYGTFRRNLDGSPAVRVGDGDPMDLSPDNKWAISRLPSKPNQILLLPTGTGESRQLTHSNISHLYGRWLPDGRIIFVGNETGHPERTYLVDMNGNEKPLTPEGILARAVATDGKNLIVSDLDSAQFQLFPLDGGQPRPLPQLQKGDTPQDFTSDDKAILLRRSGKDAAI